VIFNARRGDLRLRAAMIREKAHERCQQSDGAPDAQQRLRGFIHLADSVQLLLLHDASASIADMQKDLLDLAESVLHGLEDDVRALEDRMARQRPDLSGAMCSAQL
jgi:hypothetical protein